MPWIREGNGTPLQYSCLESPMDGGAWWAAVHGVAESWTWLSDFTFTFHFHALEKETATHSSVLAWRIPGTAEPGGLPSMGSHRVGHDWSDLTAAAAAAAAAVPWIEPSVYFFTNIFCVGRATQQGLSLSFLGYSFICHSIWNHCFESEWVHSFGILSNSAFPLS